MVDTVEQHERLVEHELRGLRAEYEGDAVSTKQIEDLRGQLNGLLRNAPRHTAMIEAMRRRIAECEAELGGGGR
mgnify:CR=1 FL=1